MQGIAIILLVLLSFIAAPILLLWAVSTIWDVHTPYDFEHWAAALVFIIAIGGMTVKFKKE